MAEREFTGRHAAAVFVGAFAVIIAVNVALAVSAVRTFPGLEVANSYVASQEFNERRAAQEALGWTVEAREADGRITLAFTGRDGVPVQPKTLRAVVGRATEISEDVEPDLVFTGEVYEAPLELGGGRWKVRINATAEDGTEFVQKVSLHVKK